MSRPATLLSALLVALALLLPAGCTRYHATAPKLLDDDGRTLEKTHYQAELVAPDGKHIRFTVWQPSLRPGQTAPLILHAHGFGLSRMDSKFDLYSLLLAGKAIQNAWDHGYWVISFDQRGFGASQGKIGLMEWDKEVADVSLLIDWAQKNLAVTAVDGDPKVGMIGESYGGGVQLLASVRDPRIDAIVPITTWYDLEHDLIPNGVPKSEWELFLGAIGYGTHPFHMDGSITAALFKEIIFNQPQPSLRQRLHRNSLASHCEAEEYPHADALLIQGFRDVIFPVDEAVKMRDCFLKGGRDARVIAVEHGHLAPTAQLPPIGIGNLPIWYVAPTVRCSGSEYSLQDMIQHWFDLKLRDRPNLDATVPHWCMTGDRAVDAAQAFPPKMQVQIPAVRVGSRVSGLFEWFMRPLDVAGNWFVPNRLPEHWDQPSNGWLRPARVPLLVADGPTWLVGTPHVELDIYDAGQAYPNFFLRLAKWKPGSGMYHILSQQVTPIRGTGHLSIDLSSVRGKIERGEVVGLLLQGHSNQFRLAGSGWGTDATFSGTIELPLAGASR